MKMLITLSRLQEMAGCEVELQGSVHKIRKMSGFAFVLLRTHRELVQCIWSPVWCVQEIEGLAEECCLQAIGLVVAEPRSKTGFEVRLLRFHVLSRPVQSPPVCINGAVLSASLETLLDYRALTLRNPAQRAIFRISQGIAEGFRQCLVLNGFTEIHSPKIVSEGAEGGADLFAVDYFGCPAYLAQSPQFYKQIAAAVFGRVFEIGAVYRAEPHDTARHLNEYTGLDFEMAYLSGFTELMEAEIEVLEYNFIHLRKAYGYECQALNLTLPEKVDAAVIRFDEAKAVISRTFGYCSRSCDDLDPEEERLLCRHFLREQGTDWVFVTHYPTSKRPFYAMEDPENPAFTLSFDLLYRGMEITTGGQRIHDYDTQIAKMKARGMDPEQFSSYLMLHKYGAPPHGGLGLGLERLTMQMCGLDNVRRAAMFPRDARRLTP